MVPEIAMRKIDFSVNEKKVRVFFIEGWKVVMKLLDDRIIQNVVRLNVLMQLSYLQHTIIFLFDYKIYRTPSTRFTFLQTVAQYEVKTTYYRELSKILFVLIHKK